jgi:hypothetical protein
VSHCFESDVTERYLEIMGRRAETDYVVKFTVDIFEGFVVSALAS